MTITAQLTGDDGLSLLIRLDENFDKSASRDFEDLYTAAPEDANFIVDFRNVRRIDPAGISLLLRLHEYAGSNLVRIQNCTGHARELLSRYRLDKLFAVV